VPKPQEATLSYRIPFNKPALVGKELDYIAQAARGGRIAGDGLFTRKCEAALEEQLGVRRAFLTHSGTAALEMAAILCGIEANDEVVMPSFTFVSTANAFYRQGARPIFVDIRPETLTMDEARIEAAITPRTRAIVPVHYAGRCCDMATIVEIAGRHGCRVIEDAAQGLGTRCGDRDSGGFAGRFAGTMGDCGTLSFHETKNVVCGEGGALLVNNEDFVARAEIIRDMGTDRGRFRRGEVDRYTWVDVGSSYLPSDLIAAFLYGQLEQLPVINRRYADIFARYHAALTPLAEDGLLQLPDADQTTPGGSHLYYIIVEGETVRDALIAWLKAQGIQAVFHYVPLHLSAVGLRLGYVAGELPVTEDLSTRVLRLPFYYELSPTEQDEVVVRIKEFFKR
jgi:dTDP-4-amino-4,6-dideoxygalactose transaminase